MASRETCCRSASSRCCLAATCSPMRRRLQPPPGRNTASSLLTSRRRAAYRPVTADHTLAAAGADMGFPVAARRSNGANRSLKNGATSAQTASPCALVRRFTFATSSRTAFMANRGSERMWPARSQRPALTDASCGRNHAPFDSCAARSNALPTNAASVSSSPVIVTVSKSPRFAYVTSRSFSPRAAFIATLARRRSWPANRSASPSSPSAATI